MENPTLVLRRPHACAELARGCRSVAHVTVAHTLDDSLDTTAISLNQSRSTTIARVARVARAFLSSVFNMIAELA